MMTRGRKSWMSCTCRSVMPPLTGTTVAPSRSTPWRPETAGEEAVAVGDVDDVAGTAAGEPDRAGHEVGPRVDVGLGVAHHGGTPGGPRARVNAYDLLPRDREHPEGVVGAQVRLGRERHTTHVVERLQVIRMETLGLKGIPIVRDVVVCRPHRPSQTLELQVAQLAHLEGRDLVVGEGRSARG